MSSAYLGNYRAAVKTLLGSKIFVSTKDLKVAPHLLLDGEWEAWMTRAIHPYLKGALFFDIGANYGWYCLVAKHAGARKIVAFEPSKPIFQLLRATMELNGIPAEVIEAGVGDLYKTLRLYSDEKCPGSATFLNLAAARQQAGIGDLPIPKEGYDVPVLVLDGEVEELLQREPDLKRAPVVLKIDVEGFEPRVVRGARRLLSRRDVPVTVFIEHHPDPEERFGFSEMLDFFEAQGFILNLVEHDDSIVKITREQLNEVPDAEMLCFRRIST